MKYIILFGKINPITKLSNYTELPIHPIALIPLAYYSITICDENIKPLALIAHKPNRKLVKKISKRIVKQLIQNHGGGSDTVRITPDKKSVEIKELGLQYDVLYTYEIK